MLDLEYKQGKRKIAFLAQTGLLHEKGAPGTFLAPVVVPSGSRAGTWID